ncbi:CehA/McbA family metallohydrolase [Svornostia abyssi]|uniref:CehA/McbA family metallohydrolase n=1 Tax=Svornostia abyssi TaxID=2898438 RepID=A0ABY5PJT7_9ACTN|nr:CehA/McbA family metallohydrolase [Parviterribacteraceae bacterium J379]
MTAPLAIAHVTPYAWEDGAHPVNQHVAAVTDELAARGHRVLVIAPTRDSTRVRTDRKLLRSDPTALLPAPGEPPRVIAIGELLPEVSAGRRRAAVPVDITRAIEQLHESLALDICHVHEPFAPSVSSAALRHSRALNVGTFHAPSERLVSTQLARRVVELVFGRLDVRLAGFEATAHLMDRFFPASYRVLNPGAVVPAPSPTRIGPVRIVFVDREERAALRAFLRGLRRLDPETNWDATVVSARGLSSSTPLRADLKTRVKVVEPDDGGAASAVADADVVVLASEGARPAPDVVLAAIGAGAIPLASEIPVYQELLADGDRGLLFTPREPELLAAQLDRLVGDSALRNRLRAAGDELRADTLPYPKVTDRLDAVYEELVGRRHGDRTNPAARKRVADRPVIDVDLHMHTDHSGDCATPVEVLLATARDQGLGAIAVTDHNEVSGALDAAEKAKDYGVKVIVAEEVKTKEQGEVIGLFIKEKIPRGMTLAETIAEIKRQGGLVYVPHPFDRMHAVPDYEHLLDIVDDIDLIEVYNPRVAIGAFNEEAQRFAEKYRIPAAAGSDSHVAQGLGTVRNRMPNFEGPEEFLASLRQNQIITKPGTLLYVQALKFLETKATPPAARRARKARRVKRATRNG